MAKTKAPKSRPLNRPAEKPKLSLKPQSNPNKAIKSNKKPKPVKSKPNKGHKKEEEADPILFGSSSPPSSPERDLDSLLDPYTKPQLISFLLDAALSDPDLRARILSLANSDSAHRKLFVHGLSWDATKQNLIDSFSPFGPIEDCNIILDKVTGRCKGFGFVLFQTRIAAMKALKEPQKRVGTRMASCQLASAGGVKPVETGARRIYVSNVPKNVGAERLKEFFGRFGEIESGPLGFDPNTGLSKGYAIFVYKSVEEAKKVLEEPYKMFDGQQLHCKVAAPAGTSERTKINGNVAAGSQVQAGVNPAAALAAQQQAAAAAQQQQSVFAAVAAAQNLALMGQNPAYAALLAQNPMMMAAAAAAAMNPALMNAAALGGLPGVQYGGAGAGQSLLGVYSAGQGAQGTGSVGIPGYQAGSSSQTAGQTSQSGQVSGGKAAGGLGGYRSSYMW